jgi:imidazolonepropionase-like amidohydrolase
VVLPGGAERDVFVGDDGRVSFDGTVGDARTLAEGVFLVPGLVDAHAHLTLRLDGAPADDSDVLSQARDQVEGGVLLVREPGAVSHVTATLEGEGLPRIITAGRWLAGRGRFIPGWAREVDGDELADAAVEELRAGGGGWAKVVGDWRFEDRFQPSFHAETLADVVRRVHDAGGRVAIHAIQRETVEMAVAAGCDSIEHGTFASADSIAAIAGAGIALTPTVGAVVSPQAVGASEVARTRAAALDDSVGSTVRAAWEAGVTLMAGTDVAIEHGRVREEIRMIASCGVPAEAALAAGSWAARAFLGLPGIGEGARADIVAYVRDPREDLSVLDAPVAVVLDGRLVDPGRR